MPTEVLHWTVGIADTTAQSGYTVRPGDRSTYAPRINRRYLVGPIAPGYTIIRPLLVSIETDDDGAVIISDDLFGVYGTGKTEAQARNDYITALIEYFDLVAARAETSEANLSLFASLENYVHASD